VIPDPRRRKDGICALPGCDKPLRKVKPQKGVPISVYENEPFCSTSCARAWHGASLPPVKYVAPNADGQAA
jgi:hypothetical protein